MVNTVPDSDGLDIHLMQDTEMQSVCDLVLRVFDEFVASGVSPGGIERFRESVTVDTLRHQAVTHRLFVLVAEMDTTLAGVIVVRSLSHIQWLFVDAACQRRGIARRLVQRATEYCREQLPGIRSITVNASLNSVVAYSAMGFVATGPQSEHLGIPFLPMAKQLPAGQSR